MRTKTLALLRKYYLNHMDGAKDNKDIRKEKENLIKYNTVYEMALKLDILTEREMTEQRKDLEDAFFTK